MTLEERVAALEAEIAAMTAVQEPTEYYMSKYSGEETDTLLDKVKNGEAGGGGVSSFNGRSGVVMPQAGDYTADMIGAPSMLDKGKAGGFPPLDNNTRIPMDYLYEEAVGTEGPPGKTPVKGVDYWTEADKEEITADLFPLVEDAAASADQAAAAATEASSAAAESAAALEAISADFQTIETSIVSLRGNETLYQAWAAGQMEVPG